MVTIILFLCIPLFLITAVIFSPMIAGVIIWWLKPILERPLIDYLARQSFSQPTSTWLSIKSLKQLNFTDVAKMLTIYRLSPNRVYLAPVEQLEKLKGKQKKSRKHILLGRSNHKQTFWLLFCVHIEFLITLLMMLIIYNFIPQGIDIDEQFVFSNLSNNSFEDIYNYCYLFSIIIIMPYFVTGGFLSYLNSRMILEGWDIELAFKRIAKNKIMAFALCAFFSFPLIFPVEVYAQETPSSNEISVDKNTEKENLIRHEIITLYEENKWIEKQSVWRPIIDNKEDKKSNFDFSWLKNLAYLGTILAYVAWGIVILLCGWVIYRVSQNQGNFVDRVLPKRKNKKIDVTHETPVFFDTPAQEIPPNYLLPLAKKASEKGDLRSALMYLLNFSLFHAQTIASITLHKSMSEVECLSALKKALPQQSHQLYKLLFDTWIQQAWAHRDAKQETIEHLIVQFEAISAEFVNV